MEEDQNGFAFDFGLIIRLGSMVNVAGVGYNLIAHDTPQYPRAVAGGLAIRPVDAMSVVFDARWDLESEPDEMRGVRFGGGAEYFFSAGDRQSGFPLRAGVLRTLYAETRFDFRFCFNEGEIEDKQNWYGPETTIGLQFLVGIGWSYKGILARLSYAYTRYGFSFSEDANARADQGLRGAGGALDQYHALSLAGGYAF